MTKKKPQNKVTPKAKPEVSAEKEAEEAAAAAAAEALQIKAEMAPEPEPEPAKSLQEMSLAERLAANEAARLAPPKENLVELSRGFDPAVVQVPYTVLHHSDPRILGRTVRAWKAKGYVHAIPSQEIFVDRWTNLTNNVEVVNYVAELVLPAELRSEPTEDEIAMYEALNINVEEDWTILRVGSNVEDAVTEGGGTEKVRRSIYYNLGRYVRAYMSAGYEPTGHLVMDRSLRPIGRVLQGFYLRPMTRRNG